MTWGRGVRGAFLVCLGLLGCRVLEYEFGWPSRTDTVDAMFFASLGYLIAWSDGRSVYAAAVKRS